MKTTTTERTATARADSLQEVGMPRLPVRIWLCLTGWRRWRQRLAVGRASCVLNHLGHYDLAHKLHKLSDKMWADEWKRHTKDSATPSP